MDDSREKPFPCVPSEVTEMRLVAPVTRNGNGADLESNHLHHFLRLSRLTLVVALLYVWLFAFGTAVIKRGYRPLVDRVDRRDLSVFGIGFDMLERCLINNLRISIRDVPYFT
jgi:hypothetical protein